MMGEIGDLMWGLLASVLVLLIITAFIGGIINTGLTPEPGDPFYIAWLDVTRYGLQALVWVVPGVGAAAYLVLKLADDMSGF